MVGIVLGILAALVTGAVMAFIVLKHLRKQKKGEQKLCHVSLMQIFCSHSLTSTAVMRKKQFYHSFILLYPQLHWQKIACLTFPIVVHVIIVWIYFPWETTDVVRQHLHISNTF